jgi:hypothetical protein
MIEGGTPNTLLRRGFTKNSTSRRHGNPRRRLPGQGRIQSCQWTRFNIPGRTQDFLGRVRWGRTTADRAEAAIRKIGQFRIGRILHFENPKSEVLIGLGSVRLKLRISDLKCRIRPIRNCPI